MVFMVVRGVSAPLKIQGVEFSPSSRRLDQNPLKLVFEL